MSAVVKIREVLGPKAREARLLSENLTLVPSSGATPQRIADFERQLPRPLSEIHRSILSVWNGLDLDVIHILGIPPTDEGIRPITACQEFVPTEPRYAGAIAFASDPSGFVYFELPDGSVHVWDHDGGETEQNARDIDDFIDHFIFGSRSAEFAGEEWFRKLHALGLT